jgi:hypothetical protein
VKRDPADVVHCPDELLASLSATLVFIRDVLIPRL